MQSHESTPTAPDELPTELIESLDALDRPALRAVHTYVEQLLEYSRSQLVEQHLAETSGEIVDIDDSEGYLLVRKRQPGQDHSGGDPQPVSLYRVKLETHPDGEETVHWSFIGDLTDPEGIACGNCGESLDEWADVCPHCGEDIDSYDFQE